MDFWEIALSFGGIFTIGSFVFLSLYKEWLKADALKYLNRIQIYNLMKLFLVLTFLSFSFTALLYSNSYANNSNNKKKDVDKTINKESKVQVEEIEGKANFDMTEGDAIKKDAKIGTVKKEGTLNVKM